MLKYKNEINKYLEELNNAQYTGEMPEPLSEAAQSVLDSVNGDFGLLNELIAKTQTAIEGVNNLPISEKTSTTNKSIKEKILEMFTNTIKGIVFTAKSNEDYENISEIEKAIKSLTNTIKVLGEKKDPDYQDLIDTYKQQLEELNKLQEVVKERISDKEKQQEKIAGQTLELQKDSIDGNPELLQVISDVTGLDLADLDNQLKDKSVWEKIGYLSNIISLVKTQITPEQLQKLKNIQKALAGQIEALVATSQSGNLVDRVKKDYSKNPRFLFNDIVQIVIKYSADKSSAYYKYGKDFNFYNLL